MTLLIGLLIAGTLLLVAEIFLPGMIAGIFGLICWFGAVVWAGVEFGTSTALAVLAGEAVGGLALFLAWMNWFPKSKLGARFSLPPTPDQRSAEDHNLLLGKTGETLTSLRPSGVARIDGRRVDVISEGRHLDPGEQVEVVNVEGSRIVVRTFQNSNPTTNTQ